MSKKKKEIFLILGALILLFILKMLFTPAIIYEYDIYTFVAWADALAEHGMAKVYEVWTPPYLGEPSYPPGSMYALAFIGWVAHTFLDVTTQIGEIIYISLLKLPSILFDLATALAIYLIFRRKYSMEKAFFPFLLYLVNPATWLASSLWGATDSWHTFFVLLCFYFLAENKFMKSGIFLALATMMKPQALIFIPFVFIFIFIYRGWKDLLRSGLASMGTVLVISLPWIVSGRGELLWSILTNPVGYFVRLSSLAFNLWFLIYGNASFMINDNDQIFSFITYKHVGLALFSLVYFGILLFCYLQRKKIRKSGAAELRFLLIFAGAAILSQALFLFTTEMHERYMFQVMPLVLMLYYFRKEMKHFYIYFMLIIFINNVLCLALQALRNDLAALFIVDSISRGLSLLNLIIFGLFIAYIKKIYQGLTQ